MKYLWPVIWAIVWVAAAVSMLIRPESLSSETGIMLGSLALAKLAWKDAR